MSNGPEFFQTMMGQKFYEATMPRLVKQLERLNDNLEHRRPAAKATPSHILKTMRISTAHVEKQAAEMLDRQDRLYVPLGNIFNKTEKSGFEVTSGPVGVGWLVTVPTVPMSETPHTDPTIGEDLVSLIKVVAYAQQHGCQWLMLDRDADTIPDLPTYQW